MHARDVPQEIIAIEEERARAIVAGDRAHLAQLLSDELVHVHASGRVDTKKTYLQRFDGGMRPFRRWAYRDAAARAYGEVALFSALVDIETTDRSVVSRASSVWVKRDGRWVQVLWHATLVIDGGEPGGRS